MVGHSTQERNGVPLALAFQADPLRKRAFVSKQVCPSSILFFSRRFFGSHNCKVILCNYVTGKLKKVFPSILALLEPFCSCVLLVKHQQFLESNFANNSNDKTTFVASRVLWKGSKGRNLEFSPKGDGRPGP